MNATETLREGSPRKAYSIWDELLPQSSGLDHKRRTAFFYRKWAINVAQDARKSYLNGFFPDYTKTHAEIAKGYLRSYREALARRAA